MAGPTGVAETTGVEGIGVAGPEAVTLGATTGASLAAFAASTLEAAGAFDAFKAGVLAASGARRRRTTTVGCRWRTSARCGRALRADAGDGAG